MADRRPTILVLLGCFNPAHRASGPNQSMISNAAALADKFRFLVAGQAAPGEEPMRWGQMDGIERIAVPFDPLLPLRLRRLIASTPHDLLVANGFFDRRFTMTALGLRWLGALPRSPMLLAPRGEFNPGALRLSARRKRAYLSAAQRLGLLRGVHLQATDALEAEAIRAILPNGPPVLIGPNVRQLPPLPRHRPRAEGEPLRIAFFSRIDRIKNLDFALKLLAKAGNRARFDIIGPVSNQAYWSSCEPLMETLPSSVEVTISGQIAPAESIARLAQYDLLLLPTGGENYGHAIVDALVAGTPALISDRTRWRGLADASAGADLPLDDESSWLEWLRRFAAMDAEALRRWRDGARRYIESALDPARSAAQLEHCFRTAMTSKQRE